jgi:hypothetical protein
MLDDIRNAINWGLRDGCRVRPGNTQEVDCLVGLFRTTLPLIDVAAAGASDASRTIRVGGIYCHQSPKLQIGGYAPCEIGDVLVVVRRESPAAVKYQALLLQTKMTSGTMPQPGEPQHDLYASWPTFQWVKTGKSRSVPDPRPHEGGQFGILTTCDRGCPRCSAEATVPGDQAQPLPEEIYEVLELRSGREFEEATSPAATSGDGWTRVIWDLLKFTVGSVIYNWHAAGAANEPRDFNLSGIFFARSSLDLPEFLAPIAGNPHIASFDEAWSARDAFLPPPPGRWAPEWRQPEEDDPGGISTLFVEVVDENEEQRPL